MVEGSAGQEGLARVPLPAEVPGEAAFNQVQEGVLPLEPSSAIGYERASLFGRDGKGDHGAFP
jgi:hypothetical protein